MYEVFDSFLKLNTWSSGHWTDDGRFCHALAAVIDRTDFYPDEMGKYIIEKLGLAENDLRRKTVEDYVKRAGVVQWYKRHLEV